VVCFVEGHLLILVNKSLVCNVSLVTNNERLMTVQLGNVLFVNVYLPGASISGRNEIISDICSQIEDNTDLRDDDKNFVIIGGDFNLEFKMDLVVVKTLLVLYLILICMFVTVISTLMLATHESRGCSSWVDHFLISRVKNPTSSDF